MSLSHQRIEQSSNDVLTRPYRTAYSLERDRDADSEARDREADSPSRNRTAYSIAP